MAISGNIRRHWAILDDIGRDWAILGNIGRYWVILSDIKQYRLYYLGISMGYNDYSSHRIPLYTQPRTQALFSYENIIS